MIPAWETEDECVDVTHFGSNARSYVKTISACDQNIQNARALYVAGDIQAEDFEAYVDKALAEERERARL